ncbi:MAG: hypothetical protein QXF61_07320 [Nitrososphaeria archaeon]
MNISSITHNTTTHIDNILHMSTTKSPVKLKSLVIGVPVYHGLESRTVPSSFIRFHVKVE